MMIRTRYKIGPIVLIPFGMAVSLKNGMLTFHEYFVAKYRVEINSVSQTATAINS